MSSTEILLQARPPAGTATCASTSAMAGDCSASSLALTVAWPLSILMPEARSGLPQNPGMSFALDVIARHPGFERALGRLREGWRAERLIHTDMKWDNCVVEMRSGDASGEAEPGVRIADWEM